MHSFFYKKVFEAFDDNSAEAAKRKIYREKAGVKYVWHPREKSEEKAEEKEENGPRGQK